jgi:SAM-dependent methyltransferase
VPGVENDYDRFAKYFRAYSEARAAYIGAVDAIVIGDIAAHARSMLDVGSGDGVRAARIARARGLTTLVLAEPSAAMVAACYRQNATEIWAVAAEELPDTGLRFDVITCLWNVLGHVSSRTRRVRALRRMRSLLAETGSVFLDVSNRYNAREYGWTPTLGRILYDLVFPATTNGDAAMTWSIEGAPIPAHTHFFTPQELRELILEAGLRIARMHVVDYRTGDAKRFFFEGQLLWQLTPDADPASQGRG